MKAHEKQRKTAKRIANGLRFLKNIASWPMRMLAALALRDSEAIYNTDMAWNPGRFSIDCHSPNPLTTPQH